jgi:3-hydroxypropanoate dehydrogenase
VNRLDDIAIDRIFRAARTHNALTGPVTDDDLRAIHDLAKMGPTAANSLPGRFVFVRTPEGKERLRPALAKGNLDKTMAAPVTVIAAYDMAFYENLPRTFPHVDARSWYAGKAAAFIESTAFRSATLQAAYFIIAARALGWDTGPMSGFDNAKLDAEFFPDGQWKSNFLINLGRGDASKLHPRNPRLSFEEACRLV